jgi:hypothetical protein
MHKSATKCNETVGKWCKNKHGASKIIDTLETYQLPQGDCIKWNDADYMDSASSKKKKLPGAPAANPRVPAANPEVAAAQLAAKPIPIACELLSIQQRLHLLADSTNVSVLLIHIPSPRKCRLSGIPTSGIFNYALSFFQIQLSGI